MIITLRMLMSNQYQAERYNVTSVVTIHNDNRLHDTTLWKDRHAACRWIPSQL